MSDSTEQPKTPGAAGDPAPAADAPGPHDANALNDDTPPPEEDAPSPQEDTSPTEEDAPSSQEDTPPRGGAIKFFVIFSVITLGLLFGYRQYMIGTALNDWYLFQVGAHTSVALSWIGHSADMEAPYLVSYDPQTIRASLAAWEAGEEEPTPEAIAAADASPLTPWEAYAYRAREARKAELMQSYGPHVAFVLRASLTTQLRQARETLRTAQSAGASEAEVAALQDDVAGLETEYEAALADPDRQEELRTVAFPFIVVPECGAIEVMAVFLAAVIALPTTWKARLIGLLAGLPLMYFVNVFRLACLAIIGALDESREIFDFVHHYVWQTVYIVFVVVVWLAWIELFARRKDPAA